MKDLAFLGIWVVAVTVCFLLLANEFDKSNDLMGVGTCVESNAYLEGFQGTSKEKWEVFAEYCKSEIRKEK